MIKVSVPGKLYISGEYAVLQAQQPAIIVALDRYLTAEMIEIPEENGHNNNFIQSRQLGLSDLHFNWQNDWQEIVQVLGLKVGVTDDISESAIDRTVWNGWKYVIAAIHTYQTYFGQPLKTFHLVFQTDLVHESGDKIGLGSSGAVVVATLKALYEFHTEQVLPALELYKLAAIALTRLGSQGSMGDIAANSFGGWIYYQSFNRQWLQDQLEKLPTADLGALSKSLQELVSRDWPDLEIQILHVDSKIDLLVGWTQSPASTDQLVKNLQSQLYIDDGAYYQQFLRESKRLVMALKDALISGDFPKISSELYRYSQLLEKLSSTYQIGILTPDLRKLIEIAEQWDYAGKSSGAGGGDCGIALGIKEASASEHIYDQWQAAGILPLKLKVSPPINHKGD